MNYSLSVNADKQLQKLSKEIQRKFTKQPKNMKLVSINITVLPTR